MCDRIGKRFQFAVGAFQDGRALDQVPIEDLDFPLLLLPLGNVNARQRDRALVHTEYESEKVFLWVHLE